MPFAERQRKSKKESLAERRQNCLLLLFIAWGVSKEGGESHEKEV